MFGKIFLSLRQALKIGRNIEILGSNGSEKRNEIK